MAAVIKPALRSSLCSTVFGSVTVEPAVTWYVRRSSQMIVCS